MKLLSATLLALLLASLVACNGSSSSSSKTASTTEPEVSTPSTPSDPRDDDDEVMRDGDIQVLSNRADLISDGNALIRVLGPDMTGADSAVLKINGAPSDNHLQQQDDGSLMGLVSGFSLGENTLSLVFADGSKIERQLINHPWGGPVFSGPQIQPWRCKNDDLRVDDQCNQPPQYHFKYVRADKLQSMISNFDPADPKLPDAFEPYDPENPPAASEIAETTTDQGITVPFIVRVESGVVDRDRYQIMTLYQPDQPWDALNPQPQWNHKLLIHHGGNVGVAYGMGKVPQGDISGTAPEGTEILLGDSITVALGRGFMTMATALNNLGHNENHVTAAESMMMVKERIVEQYGPLRYTIGTGCSGGAIMQQVVANAYPGIYQGIIVQCSYPDVWTTATQFAEYNIANRYFGLTIPEAPEDVANQLQTMLSSGVIPVVQWLAFYGHLPINPVVSDVAFFPAANPHQDSCPGLADDVPVYDADTTPDGLRCGLMDFMISQLGERPQSEWSETEINQGKGWAGIPLDSVGVQYGLKALQAGLITGAQFLQVNRDIGGLNIDINHQPERTRGDLGAIENTYRTGAVNLAQHLGNIPIIDLRGIDPGIAHDAYHSWQMRARLDRSQGHHNNQVIWYGPFPIAGDTTFTTQALLVIDRWLENVEQDQSDASIEQKVVSNKPTQARDRCLGLSAIVDSEYGNMIPLTGNLLTPDPLIPGLDPALLTAPIPPQLGIVVDAVTHQVCGLDLPDLIGVTGGQLAALLALPAAQLSEQAATMMTEGIDDLTGLGSDGLATLDGVLGPLADLQHLIVQTRFSTPRMMAGDDITTLTNKCQLKTPDPADYAGAPLIGLLDLPGLAEQLTQLADDPTGLPDQITGLLPSLISNPNTVADKLLGLFNQAQEDPTALPGDILQTLLEVATPDPQAFADKVAAIFPEGVCDFSKPPVGLTDNIPWLQYGSANEVIYGGAPLTTEATAADSRQGWASPSFDLAM